MLTRDVNSDINPQLNTERSTTSGPSPWNFHKSLKIIELCQLYKNHRIGSGRESLYSTPEDGLALLQECATYAADAKCPPLRRDAWGLEGARSQWISGHDLEWISAQLLGIGIDISSNAVGYVLVNRTCGFTGTADTPE